MKNGYIPIKPTNGPVVPRVKYALEIMLPGSGYDSALRLEAAKPFLAIRTGDIFNPRTWATVPEEVHGMVLIVESVEHMLWHVGDVITHKVVAYTRAVPDRKEARFPRKPRKK